MSETWSHFCYEQEVVELSKEYVRCPQCGRFDFTRLKIERET